MTHRPNAITHSLLSSIQCCLGWYDIHLLFSVFSRRQTCAPLTQNPGDATGPEIALWSYDRKRISFSCQTADVIAVKYFFGDWVHGPLTTPVLQIC